MFEFHWTLPGRKSDHDLRLRILARSGWIGRKILLLDDKPLYTRNWFGGINHTFPHPEQPNRSVHLEAVPDHQTRQWQPQLTLDDAVLPEQSGNPPPPVPRRPGLLAVVIGLTYLVMLMMLIMLPHIWRMLNAGFGHSDTRVMVLEVAAAEPGPGPRLHGEPLPAEPREPRILTRTLPIAREGKPYAATLRAVGGEPFVNERSGDAYYHWVINERKLPKGLEADRKTGAITGTPRAGAAGAYPVTIRVFDDAYSPLEHIAPWIAPFAATAVCLLGFWNMRRWSVILYAVFILGQLVGGVTDTGSAWMPVNVTGLILQGLIFALGARSYTAMR